ncbi:uncharacterized protein LOC111615444 [Centruroides sculpturatus]|uniref:uncharacterized protein LOC111615444 n=1 Tax=Centruroides sculpturatus TaxID=218467 RepID=UPI000C6ED00D|nr:uncharacterized protein LOC111615444 [Centruroides sculpturatus]
MIAFNISSIIPDNFNQPRPEFNLIGADWYGLQNYLQTYLPICNRENPQATELSIDSSIEMIKTACNKFIPRYISNRKHIAPWWNDDLRTFRTVNIRLRKTFQRCHVEPQRSIHKINYLEHLKNYKNAIKMAKFNSWREFCRNVGNNFWGFITRYCTKKLRRKQILHSTNIGQTFEEVANRKMDTFCLPDHIFQENEQHRIVRENIQSNIYTNDTLEFTTEETAWALTKMNNKKAAGYDDITPLLAKQLWVIIPDQLSEIYNTCLRIGIFPNSWKRKGS